MARASARCADLRAALCACASASRGRAAREQGTRARESHTRLFAAARARSAAGAVRVRPGVARAAAGARPGCSCARARAPTAATHCRSDCRRRRIAVATCRCTTRQCAQELGTIRHDPLRRTGRRRRPLVGNEIGDREIGFVADAADDRDRAGGDRARHAFVVERPQVFERAAAAREDQHVTLRARAARVAAPARFRAGAASPCTGTG